MITKAIEQEEQSLCCCSCCPGCLQLLPFAVVVRINYAAKNARQNVNKHLTKNRSNRKAKSESSISSRWNNNKFHAKRSRSVIAQAIAALQTA